MTPRASLKLLRLLAAIGIGVSVVGLVFLLVVSISDITTRPMPTESAKRIEIIFVAILQPFLTAGLPLLVAGILYALCEIGLHMTRTNDPDQDL